MNLRTKSFLDACCWTRLLVHTDSRAHILFPFAVADLDFFWHGSSKSIWWEHMWLWSNIASTWTFNIGGYSPNSKTQTQYCGANLAAAEVETRPYKETIDVVVRRHDVMWHRYTMALWLDRGHGRMSPGRPWTGDRGSQLLFLFKVCVYLAGPAVFHYAAFLF